MTSAIQSKSDRDRIRQKAGNSRMQLDRIKKVAQEYIVDGRAASACMAEIIKLLKGQG